MNAPEPADDRIRWIDLSAHGIALHAVRLPSGRCCARSPKGGFARM